MQNIYRSVNYLLPYVEIAPNVYRWISLLEGEVHTGDSGPAASVVETELKTSPNWVAGNTPTSRKIGEIDLRTRQITLYEDESLLAGQ
jgi:hypothetical protein